MIDLLLIYVFYIFISINYYFLSEDLATFAGQ